MGWGEDLSVMPENSNLLDLNMAARKVPQTSPPPRTMSIAEMKQGAAILKRRIAEIEAMDPRSVTEANLHALENKVAESLDRVFGSNGNDRYRYASAATFDHGPISISWGDERPRDRTHYFIDGKAQSLATLNSAVETLEERITDSVSEQGSKQAVAAVDGEASDKIFIVHGHDGELKQEVARTISELGLKPIILHEQPSGGKTIIEKFERDSDVGFAIILFSPDDVGGPTGGEIKSRARQNVVLELGYFIGKLGRDRVCVISRGAVEKPSDIHGVVWIDYNGHWKVDLGKELKHANYDVDFNKLF